MDATDHPLLAPRPLDEPIAYRQGQALSARQFLADAAQSALRMPAGTQGVLNLCNDRYHFSVVMAAAMMRRVPTLMPPNDLPATLSVLHQQHSALWMVKSLPDAPQPLDSMAPLDMPAQSDGSGLPRVPSRLEAAVLMTSGSTGTPMPHGRSFGSMVLSAQAQASRLAQSLGLPSLRGLTLLATVPPQHSYGFESSVMLALHGGANFAAGRPFYPADIVDAIAEIPRPRALVITPFHLKTLLAAMPGKLPALDLMLSATAPLSPQLALQAERVFGGPLLEVYGCTEAGQVATRHTTASPTWTTYGELRITERLGSTAPGEEATDASYWVHGGHVEQSTQLADVLELEDARRFKLLGRSGDVIHVAGKRSSLAHLNHHLNSIEGVDDGAFYMPADDPDGGIVRPVAFVVAPSLSPNDIARQLQSRLDAVFVPRRIIMVDALQHEDTGKITAATLKRLAQAHQIS
jgi:acyl-coenzyme A synthetase/AMP-(fatty) acid ligase